MKQLQSIDKAGMWVTSLCALHCLLLPVILPLLSMVGLSFIGEEVLERTILGLSILVGAIALSMGARKHARVYPTILLILGGAIYTAKDSLGDAGEPAIILIGASLIVAAHWINLRLLRATPIQV